MMTDLSLNDGRSALKTSISALAQATLALIGAVLALVLVTALYAGALALALNVVGDFGFSFEEIVGLAIVTEILRFKAPEKK
jgi:hypothetical protein